MEALIERVDIQDEEDDSLARFIVGLNDNIRDVLDLQNYVNLDEALQIAIAIENQQKRNSFQLKKLIHLQLARFSSSRLCSALLAQLKLNNPEVAEIYPAQGRVSYEHVDIIWGILHQSMHMHSMCGNLGMLWACGRDLGTSQACGWLNQPLSLHLFPPKWCEHTLQMCGSHCIRPKGEKGHVLRNLSLARLKLGGLYAARFSSTSAPLAQLKLNNPEAAETRPAYGRVPYKHVDSLWTSKHVHGTLFEHMHGMCIPHTWAAYVANSSNFNAAIEAFLKPSSSSSFENMLTTILTSRRYKEARFTGCPVSFGNQSLG
ncbi:hypothetical protein GQ457_16G018460 [Hibiscus cannabinus]